MTRSIDHLPSVALKYQCGANSDPLIQTPNISQQSNQLGQGEELLAVCVIHSPLYDRYRKPWLPIVSEYHNNLLDSAGSDGYNITGRSRV